jgi:hypothetical protein
MFGVSQESAVAGTLARENGSLQSVRRIPEPEPPFAKIGEVMPGMITYLPNSLTGKT